MSNNLKVTALLEQGLKNMGQHSHIDSFLQYINLLNKWNNAYNLTAIRKIDEIVAKHILDSLAILPWIHGSNLLDVGSGAGLPGIPIAITNPEIQCTLLDSNGKKTRFLNEVKRQLHLKNVEIVQFRAENYHPQQGFDTVVSRAFSNLKQMILWTQHLVAENGIWLAMKGCYPEDELKEIRKNYRVERYNLKGFADERCCIVIENKNKE